VPRDPFSFDGVDYPLDDLGSFRVVVPQKDPLAAPAVLQVTYSCHVFSEKWQDGFDADRRLEEVAGDPRAFCSVRYGCSIVLPQLINYHVAGKAYEDRDSKGARNYFFYSEADGIPYPIYFRLGRANNIRGAHGILHVISAYQKPQLRAKNTYQAVKFARLVHQKCPPQAPQSNSPSV
jgi:hypothetical protein